MARARVQRVTQEPVLTLVPVVPIPVATVLPDDGLVVMVKGADTLRVHPTCINAHQRNGWRAWPDATNTE